MASILVIDDDVMAREMLREMLEQEGYEVFEAPDGQEGIRLYRQESVDLVITDIFMPEKDGLETVRDLGREYPGAAIIAVTGYDRAEDMGCLSLARAYGAGRTFTKPFERKKMLQAVNTLLEKGT